ncbi:MAG: extracellular solute-binding protein [Spirochaetales bacterium]|nr:extracellular solute-binding protein [Spirochaetales bacterium]
MSRKTKLTAFVMAFALVAGGLAMADQVTVNWWHIGTAANDKAMLQKFADDYVKANPNVKIEITVLENEAFKSKLTTVMQGGNPPDLFQSWGGGVLAQYAQAGLLKDITKDVKGTAFGKSMASGVWQVYSYNGKVYGAPHDMGGITFWYNKELLAKVGYKTFPTTWDDFLKLVKKLKAAGITPIALGGGDKWPAMHMWSYIALRLGGGQLFEDTFSGKNAKGFENPTFIKAGQMLADLAALKPFQDGFLGATYNDEAALMGNGEAAMELMGQWAPNVEKDNSSDKTGLGAKLSTAPFPAIKGGKGKITEVIGGGNGYAVGKNAPQAAVDFLKYLDNKKNNTTWAQVSSIIPTVKGAEVGLTDPNAKMVKAIVDKCTFFQLYLDQFLSPAAGGTVNDAVQNILAGTATPAQAMAAIQKAFVAK